MSSDPIPHFHTAGVGAGPANLSLAALFEAVAPDEVALFEAQPAAAWHSGLLYSGVRMQTSWLKDLVSLVDPRHRLSFLTYLVSSGRVYTFLSAQHDSIPRLEYVRYLEWASGQLAHVHYNTRIDRISFCDDGDGRFVLYSADQPVASSEHVVLGLGSAAQVPGWVSAIGGDRAVVADRLADLLALPVQGPVAVVGGGQTGAECVLELLAHGYDDVRWFGARPWFAPLDDSPSANDFYRPAYLDYLRRLPRQSRRELIERQVLTSDGISPGTLRGLFQLNYERLLSTGRAPVTMLPSRRIIAARADDDEIVLTCTVPAGTEQHEVRRVVVAAGRAPAPLPLDEALREQIEVDQAGEPFVEDDYSLTWKGAERHKIFVQNRARYSLGLPDSNLSLLPARSATIINGLFGRTVFEMQDEHGTTHWDTPTTERAAQ